MELADVTSIDPELAAGLKGLLEYEPAADVESVFCRNFEVTWDLYGEQQRVELVEGGAEKAVTGDNRQLYVERYVKWLLDESIQAQFSALLQGFIRVVPLTSLLLLSPEELELLMVGQPHLDFKELQVRGVSHFPPSHTFIRRIFTSRYPQQSILLYGRPTQTTSEKVTGAKIIPQ